LTEPPRWLRELAEQNGMTQHIRILDEGVPEVF